jgi:hypothetical protein
MPSFSDRKIKSWLAAWPTTTEIWSPPGSGILWLRGQPATGTARSPRIAAPGSNEFETQPVGLWLSRGPSGVSASYCDCLVIESCGSTQNLADKRSRYAARTSGLVVDFRSGWLEEEIVRPGRSGPRQSRWEVLGLASSGPLQTPVRHLRVLYAVPDQKVSGLFARVKANLILEAHEYVCPQRRLGQRTADRVPGTDGASSAVFEVIRLRRARRSYGGWGRATCASTSRMT